MKIESLLSARKFLAPQLVGDRIYFVSDLSGRLSLYAMDYGGSVPEPLLPPDIALPNPDFVATAYYVFPKLDKILVMLDRNGDENYQPMLIPIDGGYPEPVFSDTLGAYRVQVLHPKIDENLFYVFAESQEEQLSFAFRCHLDSGEVVKLAESKWGSFVGGVNEGHSKQVLIETYTIGDHVLELREEGTAELRRLYGKKLEERAEGEQPPLSSIGQLYFTAEDKGLLFTTSLFDDAYSLGYMGLNGNQEIEPVVVEGVVHQGIGEMYSLEHAYDNRYFIGYNIDGSSWLYEGEFDEAARKMTFHAVVCGQGMLSNGVMNSHYYDEAGDRLILSFSTATSPTQIFTVEGKDREIVCQHTRERLLGLPQSWLSPGEDYGFVSHDGMRLSARLYLPSPELGFEGKRPLVYYIHGGPQSQEKPDFAWFSMPLIQFLTLNGFAVFVPNVRGSSGYGLSYMKHVDRDWGGQDRLDHVHAMTEVLARDERVDVSKAGVIGRSYGGYMTLTLAARHPELWAAAVDMFGPYNLLTFMERIPETWKPYFAIAVGDPEKDRDFLVERSPSTYIEQIQCPMLVIQGANDPRVIEQESREVVEQLRGIGKQVEYLVFGDEGHDILKYENKVRCYNAITDFFKAQLM